MEEGRKGEGGLAVSEKKQKTENFISVFLSLFFIFHSAVSFVIDWSLVITIIFGTTSGVHGHCR